MREIKGERLRDIERERLRVGERDRETHTDIYTRIHVHTYTRTHVHTYTHTHVYIYLITVLRRISQKSYILNFTSHITHRICTCLAVDISRESIHLIMYVMYVYT